MNDDIEHTIREVMADELNRARPSLDGGDRIQRAADLSVTAAGLAAAVRLIREPGLPVPDGWYVDETVYRDAAGGRVLVQRDGRCSAWIYTNSVGMFGSLDEAAGAVRKARHADR